MSEFELPFQFVNALRHARARFEKNPNWKRLDGTPWQSDAPVVGADLMADVARAYEARISQLEALCAEKDAALGMFKMVHFEDGEELARIEVQDGLSVQFRGGDGFFGNRVFFEATRRAASAFSNLQGEKG